MFVYEHIIIKVSVIQNALNALFYLCVSSAGGNQQVLLNALGNGGNIRTYQVPISLHDNEHNGMDTAGSPAPLGNCSNILKCNKQLLVVLTCPVLNV